MVLEAQRAIPSQREILAATQRSYTTFVGAPGVGKTTALQALGRAAAISIDHLFLQAPHFQEYAEAMAAGKLLSGQPAPEDIKRLSGLVELESIDIKSRESWRLLAQEGAPDIDGGIITGFGYAYAYNKLGRLSDEDFAQYTELFLTWGRILYRNAFLVFLTDTPDNTKQRVTGRYNDLKDKNSPEADARKHELEYSPEFIALIDQGIRFSIDLLISEGVISPERVKIITISEIGDYSREGEPRERLRRMVSETHSSLN